MASVTLLEAFQQMAADEDLTRRFTDDPKGVMQELGVDTDGVTIQQVLGGNAPYDNFKQSVDSLATDEMRSVTICGSVGMGVCVSVGG